MKIPDYGRRLPPPRTRNRGVSAIALGAVIAAAIVIVVLIVGEVAWK